MKNTSFTHDDIKALIIVALVLLTVVTLCALRFVYGMPAGTQCLTEWCPRTMGAPR